MDAGTSLGQHLLIDAGGCDVRALDDPDRVRAAVEAAVAASHATLLDLHVHRFAPHGITATATLAESHIAVHTWPEHAYFAADIFFCGDRDPRPAGEVLASRLGAGEVRYRQVERGMGP